MARPPKYDRQKVMDAICDRIAEGESLRAICLDNDMPGTTIVMEWIKESDALAKQYARARERQADYYAEQIIEIADNSGKDTVITKEGIEQVNHEAIQRDRLRVDARKWVASKLAPKKYGEKIQQEITGENGGAIQVNHMGKTKLDPKDL